MSNAHNLLKSGIQPVEIVTWKFSSRQSPYTDSTKLLFPYRKYVVLYLYSTFDPYVTIHICLINSFANIGISNWIKIYQNLIITL